VPVEVLSGVSRQGNPSPQPTQEQTMQSISSLGTWLTAASTSPDIVAVMVMLATTTLILALSISVAIVSAAKQGRIDVKIAINLGRGRNRPP
jgi:hypothetical protein